MKVFIVRAKAVVTNMFAFNILLLHITLKVIVSFFLCVCVCHQMSKTCQEKTTTTIKNDKDRLLLLFYP